MLLLLLEKIELIFLVLWWTREPWAADEMATPRSIASLGFVQEKS